MAVINVIYMYKEDQRPYYLLLLHLNRLLRLHPLLPWTRFLVLHNLLSISAACRAKNLSGPKLERMKKLLVSTSSSRESLAWWCWWLASAEPKSKSKYNKGEIVRRRLSWAQCKCCTPLGKPSLSAPAVGILCLFATSTNVF